MLEAFLCILWIFVSLFLVLIILLQRGKGGGLAGALGGVGGSSAFGTKAGDIFTRITVGVFAVWLILAMMLVWKMKPPARFVGAAGPAAKTAKEGTAKEEPKLGGDEKEAAAKKLLDDQQTAEKARLEKERLDKEKADKEKAEKEKAEQDKAKKLQDEASKAKPGSDAKASPSKDDKTSTDKSKTPPDKNAKGDGKKS